MTPIYIFLLIAAAYAAIGIAFACVFVVAGMARIDPVASRAPLRVRVLFLPGAAALWPLMLAKWIGAHKNPEPDK